ncbi:MAG: phosphatidate cytidylyltransferase [Deltaproteobacteria bacterium]|jgi:phosphatidate cytidylyltransferase|nr:phosphatidate cytidylyltransferase [Deltaproteobacteria bacterium]
MLKDRLLTAAVAIPILLAIVFGGGATGFLGLILVVNAIALHEFWALFPREGGGDSVDRSGFPLALVTTSLLVYAFHRGSNLLIAGALVSAMLTALAASVVGSSSMRARSRVVFTTLTGVLYVTVMLGHLVLVRALPEGAWWIFMLLGIVMMSDTCAYFAGRAFGKHKLAPMVSPKKTVEGAIGGLVGSALFALVAAKCLGWSGIPASQSVVLGLLTGLVSQIGDLAESTLKRGADVKDSGTIFPGHGGLLDRLDSILPGCVVLYYLIRGMGLDRVAAMLGTP